jgi:hypothetical protein
LHVAPDFNEFCELLHAHRVEFVIVGAHALAFHGAPRFTADLDILIRPTVENAERLLSAVGAFGFTDIQVTAQRGPSRRSRLGTVNRGVSP